MAAIQAFMEARDIPKMLQHIQGYGACAAEIVQNMLSFARKSSDAVSSHDQSKLLERSLDLAGSHYDMKTKSDFRQIEIVREYEDNFPLVPCEAGTIQQVVMNILRNGAEAMLENRTSDKPPRFILRLAHEKQQGKVRIEIEDNGPGMDEATRKRVFEPFSRKKRAVWGPAWDSQSPI